MKTIVISILAAFAIAVILGPIIIPVLRRLKMDQTERAEGVQTHLAKTGTPTMGGLIFLASIAVVSLICVHNHPNILPIMVLTFGFGIIGFIDDYLKVVLKRSDGLMPKQKLLLQIAVTAIFLLCMMKFTDVSMKLLIPFSGGKTFSLGWFAYPFLFLVVLATVNGVNFTDGLDGLASSVTIVVAIFFTVESFVKGAGLEPFTGAVIGGLMGFLFFNAFPARVFMGDTGSLALGGFVAATAYMLNMPLYILLIGAIYAIELLSVVMQVTYFKATHGKRIFKMTPIHHHFELCGWSETRIVAVFTIITALLCMVSLL